MITDLVRRVWMALRSKPVDPGQVRMRGVPIQHAGMLVNEDTALKYSALFRGVSYIAQSIAGLPWDVLLETEERTIPLRRHHVARLIRRRPNPEMSAFTWRETMLAWALTWGNGYSEIERDLAGRPVGLWPISPDRVAVTRDPETGRIVFEIANYAAEPTRLDAMDVFHLHGLGFDGLVGYSVVGLAARSIGLSLAAEQYVEDFFANGAVATGGYKSPVNLNDESYKRLKDEIRESRLKAGRRWIPPILEGGVEWQNMSIPNRDAQLIECRQFQVSDIARWLGIPPHKLADLSRATFSNIESQNIEVVNDCFMPWIHRLEQECDYKLFSDRDFSLRTKLNVRGLLRGDDQSRATYYQIMRGIGVYSVNDILRLEDMDPIGEEGDIRIVQAGQMSLESLLNPPAAAAEPAEDSGTAVPAQAYRIHARDAFARILRRERHRIAQNRHKFSGPDGFDGWFAAFMPEHAVYMRRTLGPVLESLVLQHPDLAGRMAGVMEAAIDRHLIETRRAGQIDNLEERADREAGMLLEHAFARLIGDGDGVD